MLSLAAITNAYPVFDGMCEVKGLCAPHVAPAGVHGTDEHRPWPAQLIQGPVLVGVFPCTSKLWWHVHGFYGNCTISGAGMELCYSPLL